MAAAHPKYPNAFSFSHLLSIIHFCHQSSSIHLKNLSKSQKHVYIINIGSYQYPRRMSFILSHINTFFHWAVFVWADFCNCTESDSGCCQVWPGTLHIQSPSEIIGDHQTWTHGHGGGGHGGIVTVFAIAHHKLSRQQDSPSGLMCDKPESLFVPERHLADMQIVSASIISEYFTLAGISSH